MKPVIALGVVLIGMIGYGRHAEAYPQYQLSRDQTCSNCHLSPAGGGLLSENGYLVAENISQFGTEPKFMYDKIPTPSWLELGGDFRGATGFIHAPDNGFALFPMQAEVYVHANYKGFSLQLTGGARPAQWVPGQSTGATPGVFDRFWSREHYLMWQSDGNNGLFVRVGRFMPVFGLRFAEHPDYNRQYGGTQLYSETYGAAVEYITQEWEAHLTGFIEDPLIDPVSHDSGVAGYGELRLNKELQLGAELMVAGHDNDTKVRGGATAKLYLPSPDVLLEAELQVVHQELTGASANQLVGYLMASHELAGSFLLDVGVGHYDENIAISGLDRDAIDVNLHWFVTSHLELVLQNRIEGLGVGQSHGGPTGGWSLLHAHYRL